LNTKQTQVLVADTGTPKLNNTHHVPIFTIIYDAITSKTLWQNARKITNKLKRLNIHIHTIRINEPLQWQRRWSVCAVNCSQMYHAAELQRRSRLCVQTAPLQGNENQKRSDISNIRREWCCHLGNTNDLIQLLLPNGEESRIMIHNQLKHPHRHQNLNASALRHTQLNSSTKLRQNPFI